MLRIIRLHRTPIFDGSSIAAVLQSRTIATGHACNQAEPLPIDNENAGVSARPQEHGTIRTDWT